MNSPDWVQKAQLSEPDGSICGFCGKPNDFADDCGWFWLSCTGKESKATCKSCYDGTPGREHIAKYGVGER